MTRETLTLKNKLAPAALTGKLRFVHQEDNRFVLQQQWAVVQGEEVVAEWRNIPVILEKDIEGYKPLKLPKKPIAKKKKVE